MIRITGNASMLRTIPIALRFVPLVKLISRHKPLIKSDPMLLAWLRDGAPSCGATWDGDYDDVLPADQREGYIGSL